MEPLKLKRAPYALRRQSGTQSNLHFACLQGGDLKQALIDDEVGLFEWGRKGKTVALDIARGLHFLHSCDVVHRCLGPTLLLRCKSPTHSPSSYCTAAAVTTPRITALTG